MGKEDDTPGASDTSSSAVVDPDEKHFSKAQFVWQIKGKYHLKCSNSEDTVKPNSDSSNSSAVEVTDSCDLVSESGSASDMGTSSLTQDSSTSVFNESADTMSPATDNSRAECPVREWQTRQVAKAFVDNTINCVLEDMGFVPLPADTEDIITDGNLEHEAVSMAILSHGLQRSDDDTCTTTSPDVSFNSFSTKLKKECSSLNNFHDRIRNINKIKSLFDESPLSDSQIGASCSSTSKPVAQNGEYLNSQNKSFIVRRVNAMTFKQSEIHCDDKSNEPICSVHGKELHMQLTDEVGSTTLGNLPANSCTCNLTQKIISSQNLEVITPFHKRKAEAVTLAENTKRCCDERSSPDKLQATHSIDSEEVSNVQKLYEKVNPFEHFDFLDAAVAAAIQKKGLSAMTCTEYG